jgi:hypothetical protein
MKQKLITILVAFGIAKANAEKYLEKVDVPDEAEFDAMWLSKFKQATGLTAEEVKDKGYKDVIALGTEKLRKKGDSTTEELQKANLALENELKDIKENVLPGKTTEVENYKKTLKSEMELEKLVLKKKLAVSPTVALAAINAVKGNGHIFELNEKGELEVFTAGENKLKVKKKDNSGFMNADEYITEILTSEKLIEVSGAPDPQKKDPIVIQGNNTTKINPNMMSNIEKANANLEEVKTNIALNDK